MNLEFEKVIQLFTQSSHNVIVEYKNSPQEWYKQSCHLFLTSSNFLGSMSVWSSAECEMKILSCVSGERVLWEYSILSTSDELEEHFKKFSQIFLFDPA